MRSNHAERRTNFSPHHWSRVKAIDYLLFTIDYCFRVISEIRGLFIYEL